VPEDQCCGSFDSVELLNFIGKGAVDKPLAKITLNVFSGGFNWPSFVAHALGFFRCQRPGRDAATDAEFGGANDRAVARRVPDRDDRGRQYRGYVEGQGEAQIGPQPEFFAFMGSDSGFLSLVAQPGIKRWRDVKGKTLSVDARTTGYAFVLFDMLRRNGLADGDYKVVRVGGMTQRWEALRAQKQDATLLSISWPKRTACIGWRGRPT
jgi:hypothetical protein